MSDDDSQDGAITPKYKVWDCKVVVPGNAELPSGFDSPPRRAVIRAVEDAGIEVIGCSSGWGGKLSELEEEIMHEVNGPDSAYVTGGSASEREAIACLVDQAKQVAKNVEALEQRVEEAKRLTTCLSQLAPLKSILADHWDEIPEHVRQKVLGLLRDEG